MFKKVLIISLLVALPGFASAWTPKVLKAKAKSNANEITKWTVNAKAMTTGGTITPAGASTYTVATTTIADFTVAPESGKQIAKVMIDGVITGPSDPVNLLNPAAGATTDTIYHVAKGTSSSHTILAYFKAGTASTATITVTQPLYGTIGITQIDAKGNPQPIPLVPLVSGVPTVPLNTTIQVKVMPKTGDYTVTKVTLNGDDLTTTTIPGTQGVVVTFPATLAVNVVTATMTKVSLVRAAYLSVTGTSLDPRGKPATQTTTTVDASDITLDGTSSIVVGGPTYATYVFNVNKQEAPNGDGSPYLLDTDYTLTDVGGSGSGMKKFTARKAGVFCVSVKVSSGNELTSDITNITAITTLDVVNQGCNSCHVGRNPDLVAQNASAANLYVLNICADCHSNSPHNQVICAKCHNNNALDTTFGQHSTQTHAFPITGPIVMQFAAATDCTHCHADKVAGGPYHNSALQPGKTSCIGCHDVPVTIHPGFNNGVRAITPEFSKNSHHVSTGTVTDAQCAACHLEGKVVSGTVVVDTTYHMAGNTIYLRNCNTSIQSSNVAYVWDPANPNHTAMDQFCMSCHNSDGATALAAAGINGVTGGSATNPFNTDITNGYDTLKRPAVVAVYEQFDTKNVAHHAVRGKKYTTRTRTAAFSNNSSAASPGVRKTIYEAGLFVADYTPLGESANVGDDSVLHCGDCHTVGQFKPGSTTTAAGTPITAAQVIGAHGSVNEYMLRTSIGDDVLHTQSNQPAGDPPIVADGTYVCFLCHAQTTEETGGYNSMGFHGGMEGSNASYCNGRAAESVGKTGFGGVKGTTRVPNLAGSGAGGVLFGYSCSGCHNAGQNNTFGGIHGGNATYKSYSTNGAKASKDNAGFVIVQAKPYRFMGGLSLRYQGGGDAAKWEAKTLNKANREGCYNQSTAADTVAVGPPAVNKTKLWGKSGALDANGVADDIAVNPNGTNGTWGSCSHHSGSTTSGSGTAPTRVGVQRPLSY